MIVQINRKDLIKQLRWPLRCLWSAFSNEWKEKKYDFEGWKKLVPRSLLCLLNISLTGEENDWAMSLSLAQLPSRAGLEEMIRVWGARSWQKQGLGELRRAGLCCQRSSTAVLLMAGFTQRLWSSVSLKLEASSPRQHRFHPFLPPCALRNPCAGAAVMRKRQQNWGVVAEDNSAGTDIVTREHPCRWLTGTCRGVSTRARRIAWVLWAEASPWHGWGCR